VEKELEKLIRASGLDPGHCVLRQVTRTSRTVVAAFDAALEPAGVTAHQFTVLVALAHGGPMKVSELADAVGMHPSTTPRKIAPLARRGLVRIRPGEDRRQRLIVLTAKGIATIKRAFPLWAEIQRRILQHLGPGAWPPVMQSLNAIRAPLSARGGKGDD
jgi:DNA-binding MarR family transcriptional regulator